MRVLYFDEHENQRVSEIDHIFVQYDECGEFIGVNIGSHDYVIAMCTDDRIESEYHNLIEDAFRNGRIDIRYDYEGEPYFFEIMTEYEDEE